MAKLVGREALALVLAAFAAPAWAGAIPDKGMTVEGVAAWLQDAGYPADILRTDQGRRYVKTNVDGTDIVLRLYDCKAPPRCSSLQFSVGFNTGGRFDAAKANAWNSRNRYVRASVDQDNDPFLDFDVNVAPGGTSEALDDNFATYRQLLRQFKTFIDWGTPEGAAGEQAGSDQSDGGGERHPRQFF